MHPSRTHKAALNTDVHSERMTVTTLLIEGKLAEKVAMHIPSPRTTMHLD